MSVQNCPHDRTAIYREPASGQAVQECLLCGIEVDRGDPADFWRGVMRPPYVVLRRLPIEQGGEALGRLPAP